MSVMFYFGSKCKIFHSGEFRPLHTLFSNVQYMQQKNIINQTIVSVDYIMECSKSLDV